VADANTSAQLGNPVILFGTFAVQQTLFRRRMEPDSRTDLTMRMYSPEELDVMAEAYDRALEKAPDKAPHDISSTEATRRLVQEIAWGVVNGVRDGEALANAALQRTSKVMPAVNAAL
jgi:hypothetical protein